MNRIWNLPPDSALHRALGAGWTVGDHLVATVADALFELHRLTVAVNSDNPKRTLKKIDPVRVPRPGEKPEEPKVVTSPVDFFAMLGGG